MKIAIIGGGASGLMCACLLGEFNLKKCGGKGAFSVTVLEGQGAAGKKLALTGNGRCNLTNMTFGQEFLKNVVQNAEFVKKCLSDFSPKDTVDFFGRIGVKTLSEDGERVIVGKNGGVLAGEKMVEYAKGCGVDFEFNCKVLGVERCGGGFNLRRLDGFGQECMRYFDTVVIATGGLSYPQTGSSGDGYEFAKGLLHDILPPRPALCGLVLDRAIDFLPVQGVCLCCNISIAGETKTLSGNILFTKSGVSGPTVFRAVSLFKKQSISGLELEIDFVPSLQKHDLKRLFDIYFKQFKNDKPFYLIKKFLPVSVSNWLCLNNPFLKGKKNCESFNAQDRIKLLNLLKGFKVKIEDFEDITRATITRGGVCISQVDTNSMQSNLVRGLYFVGELLDIDALSGGFNLQLAFSTAASCAKSIVQSLSQH
ncbi:MAG: aminoacetone oxidase family FAD-binding enzyme [Firmicutes bacterium]|nr:aminoacetone oxidase family FAD-binding enzyme [Bacillota bacterium]